jgi:predicted transcriptional regulator
MRTVPFNPMSDPTSAKKATLELVERMEEDVTFEDIMYELHVLQTIEHGRRDAAGGRTVSHEEAKERLDQWLT